MKTELYIKEKVFFSFIILKDGIYANLIKVTAIKNKLIPLTITEIKVFINVTGYLRHFIKNYLKILKLLIILISGFKIKPLYL